MDYGKFVKKRGQTEICPLLMFNWYSNQPKYLLRSPSKALPWRASSFAILWVISLGFFAI